MTVSITTTLNISSDRFAEVEAFTREKLAFHGFGIISEIDFQAILKEKINQDFYKYKILGACNPARAFKGLSEVPELGVLLPCNVVIYSLDENSVTVSIMNPEAVFTLIDGTDCLDQLQFEIGLIMNKVISDLNAEFQI
ncbi:MAG: DUF302 domain-containing protein [Candidatus Heimdallarchaeota archaeon]|nr:DUF302 domain-containing protein [Candidatus Heimdallarchaeota archaeon]MCK5048891.1 DUF302 domain-containing protein [Candidatus Heimdallarchaeota archaeon]